MLRILAWISLMLSTAVLSEEVTIHDKTRDRHIPIEVNLPVNSANCILAKKCPVAFISSGYGVKHYDYSFITVVLQELGYLVVSVQHELEGDPPLSRAPPFLETRDENWQRGVVTLSFVRQTLSLQYSSYDFDQLTLIGHSNGGDISSLFSEGQSGVVETLITMDHRRVPLPRATSIDVLTIRASDFPADQGVLLTKVEVEEFGTCEVKIEKARHNDMTDYGPAALKQAITTIIKSYLSKRRCH